MFKMKFNKNIPEELVDWLKKNLDHQFKFLRINDSTLKCSYWPLAFTFDSPKVPTENIVEGTFNFSDYSDPRKMIEDLEEFLKKFPDAKIISDLIIDYNDDPINYKHDYVAFVSGKKFIPLTKDQIEKNKLLEAEIAKEKEIFDYLMKILKEFEKQNKKCQSCGH